MRSAAVICLALLATAASAAPASAFDPWGLPPPNPQGDRACATPAPPAPSPRARAAQGIGVRATVRRYARLGAITRAQSREYRGAYASAIRARGRLGGVRRAELAAVIAQLEAFARRRALTASRLPILFHQLRRNTQHWSRKGPPTRTVPGQRTPCTGGTGTRNDRVEFPGDPIVFQWYPGQGLQIQQLGTAGKANALARACVEDAEVETPCRPERFRRALDRLVFLAADRGFLAWEYYFGFGGGTPPWISGMAQATAMQALSRGATYFNEPSYLDVARRALGAFRTAPPRGVRVATGAGNHYLLYSFAPGLRVINGFLQSLVGLHDYAEAADDEAARALFRAGDRRARQELPRYDTGAWSLYSAGGAESDLGYHRLVRDFLRALCQRTEAGTYCAAAERFDRYLYERTRVSFRPARAPRARRPATVAFSLSKLSCVTLRVRRNGVLVAKVSRVLGRGVKALSWVPRRRGTYTVQVQAVDLLNHYTRIDKTVRVR